MTLLLFSIILFFIACFAGTIGALTGLGGGAILTPVLVLVFHVNIHYAMGASLISVIATSSGAAMAYLREGYTNIRVGMFLETATVIGALFGALAIAIFPVSALAIVFGLFLLFSAFLSLRGRPADTLQSTSHPWAIALKLESTYPTPQGNQFYHVQNVPGAWSLMAVAGALSGLLGIGSGAVKVLAMDQAMHLPYRVSTTTSNFIIGITAAVSAGIYFSRGYIDPILTFPVLLGVVVGSLFGARILLKLPTKILRKIFSVVILILAFEMIYKGFSGNL